MKLQNRFYDWLLSPANRILTLLPTSSTLLKQAIDLQGAGDYQSALVLCDQALTLDATNSLAYQIRGIVKLRLGRSHSGSYDLHVAQSLYEQSQSNR